MAKLITYDVRLILANGGRATVRKRAVSNAAAREAALAEHSAAIDVAYCRRSQYAR